MIFKYLERNWRFVSKNISFIYLFRSSIPSKKKKRGTMLEGIQVKRGQRGWNRGNKRRKTGWVGARGELGGERNWGSPKCIAYARVSADNGGSQRAERIVIRNMGWRVLMSLGAGSFDHLPAFLVKRTLKTNSSSSFSSSFWNNEIFLTRG